MTERKAVQALCLIHLEQVGKQSSAGNTGMKE